MFLKFLKKIFLNISSLFISILIIFAFAYAYLAIRLPDVSQLKDARLQVPLRVFTKDGKLIGEFGEKRRSPITLDQVPPQLVTAILDTEDQRFFEHPGVDFVSLIRAAKIVFATGKKSQGASTITMQVARNFFLNSDKTYARKLNEILLALKIDQKLSKKEILELYLNQIYLGQRAYGVAAASRVYYGKELKELNLAELALIAGLPQAPSRDNPIVNPKAALERRNHVLTRMYDSDHITTKAYREAITSPLTARYHEHATEIEAPHIAEMVRSSMVQQFGPDIYDRGYSVYTTIDSRLQKSANKALRDGVLDYDERHGYRGSEKNLGKTTTQEDLKDWLKELQRFPIVNDLWPAAVIKIEAQYITALLKYGQEIRIFCSNSFARQACSTLQIGDVIRVEKMPNGVWRLRQLPTAEAAFVALDPKDGSILALNGGFSYSKSNFNRVTQSSRQAGSAFKPFIYSAALEKGFTLASIVNDAPIVITDAHSNILWRPQNDTLRFYGPTRLRVGLMKSRNLVSIRLLQAITIPYALDYLQRFGFSLNQLPYGLSLALGTASISPLQLASGYATFANGGYKITPYFISSVKNQNNEVIFSAHPKIVPGKEEQTNQNQKSEYAIRTISAQNAYLITDALKDVIRQGSATDAQALNRRDLAGKTGTTNSQNDGWFSGFNGDIVATTWVGFDQPQTLHEYGSEAALPIWINFMREALVGKPEHSMIEPEEIVTVRIDPRTGLIANPQQKDAFFELFASGTQPTQVAPFQPSNSNDNAANENESDTDHNDQQQEDPQPLF